MFLPSELRHISSWFISLLSTNSTSGLFLSNQNIREPQQASNILLLNIYNTSIILFNISSWFISLLSTNSTSGLFLSNQNIREPQQASNILLLNIYNTSIILFSISLASHAQGYSKKASVEINADNNNLEPKIHFVAFNSSYNNYVDINPSISLASHAQGYSKKASVEINADNNNLEPKIHFVAFNSSYNNYVDINPNCTEFLRRIESNADIHTYRDLKADGLVYAANGFYRNGVTEILYNKLLWSGERYPTASQTSNFQEPVSNQPHGILLVFSGYDMGSAQDVDWNTFFVSKREVAEWGGRGHGFLMSSTALNRVCQKYIYISNTFLKGHDQNNQSGTGDSGASYKNHLFVLRYVFGV